MNATQESETVTLALFYLANLLVCLAFLVRDMAWLRAITILSALCAIPYLYLQDTPLYAAIGWQLAFLAINAVNLVILLLQRRPVPLAPWQRWLHEHTFRMLSSRDMLRLLEPARTVEYRPGEPLILEGERLEHLILILEGSARVTVHEGAIAELGEGQFAGEMGFVTYHPATASVTARVATRALAWHRDDLERLYHRRPHLKDAMQVVIGSDMAEKLSSDRGAAHTIASPVLS